MSDFKAYSNFLISSRLKSVEMGLLELKNAVNSRVIDCHKRIPGVRKLPVPAVAIIIALVFVNAIVWVAVGILLVWLLGYLFL